MLPLDVYLENEHELVIGATTGEAVEELKGTLGEKLLRRDGESRVVVNFHGVSLVVVPFYFFPGLLESCTWYLPFRQKSFSLDLPSFVLLSDIFWIRSS